MYRVGPSESSQIPDRNLVMVERCGTWGDCFGGALQSYRVPHEMSLQTACTSQASLPLTESIQALIEKEFYEFLAHGR